MICALGVAAGSARADAFTWLGPTSLMSTGGHHTLPTVSCPGTGQCTTVDGQGEEITFNPSNGAILTRAAVDTIGIVSSVSCPSLAECAAVDNGGNEITFDPTTGAINAAGRDNIDPGHHLIAVSCASGTRCSAIDDHGAETTFDPSSGNVIGSQANSVDGTVPLTAVSCQSVAAGAQQCTAVDNGGGEATYVVADDGSVTSSTSPIDGSTALSSVSCPSATVCAAVDGGGFEITFDPATGTIVGSATKIDTNGSAGVALSAVSCPSTSQCVAVDAQGNEVTFAPSATPGASVNSIDGTTFLASVSCPAGTTTCVATDNHANEIDFASAGTLNSVHPIVPPAMSGVSCPTRTQCTIIESGFREVTLDPTTGTINGAGVSAIDVTGNPLTSVSCVSATECTTVDSGGNEMTFDPTTGNVIANGSVNVDSSGLRAVSCLVTSGATPAPQCTAVDTAGNEVTFNPSTSAINNSGLSPVDSSGGTLESVSCPTGIQCTAVDSHGNEVTFNPVTGIYYGTIQAVPVDQGQNLDSVACPSAGQCTAVDRAGGVITFINPAATPAIPTRIEIEVSNTPLTSVSCPSTGQCTLVDGLGQEATFSPTAPSLSPALLTPLPEANALQAVACQSTSICFAADIEGNGFAGVEPPVVTTPAAITGTAQEGVKLTAVQGTWTNFPTGYSYQWEDCPSATGTAACTAILGAMSSTYTPTATDIGQYIRVLETATNAGGAPKAFSAATAKVLPAPPTNTAAPAISGATVQQGKQLTEVQGTWHEDGSDQLSYTYRWADCDASGANCSAIAGATGATYTPTTTDVGHTILVIETAANSGGAGKPAASAPTAVVAAAPAPGIQAITLTGRRVHSTSATAGAQLVTQGVPVTWQFVYYAGRRTGQTPVQSIPAGATTPVTVSQTLTGLKPLTKYHFRVVETAAAGPYAPAATVYGNYLTFTTGPNGKIALTRTRVSVSPSGAVTVPVACRSSVACVGRFSISAESGKGRHQHTVQCVSFRRLAANEAHGVQATLAQRCLAMVRSARRHQLSATFTARPQSGQLDLVKKIKLVG